MNRPEAGLIARTRQLHGVDLGHGDPRWPEIARMQRAGLIRVTPQSRHVAALRFVEPPPPEGWIIMAAAPRDGTEIWLLNDQGEHLARWLDAAGGSFVLPRGWYRRVKNSVGQTLSHDIIPGGEPFGWRRP